LRNESTLESGMAGASSLYGVNFSPMDCVKALVYFKGGDLAQLSKEDRKTLTDSVRALHLASLAQSPLLSQSLSH
jgi:hypothetical protein